MAAPPSSTPSMPLPLESEAILPDVSSSFHLATRSAFVVLARTSHSRTIKEIEYRILPDITDLIQIEKTDKFSI
jgi:hypothetical protein